jgi:hypothetical protein
MRSCGAAIHHRQVSSKSLLPQEQRKPDRRAQDGELRRQIAEIAGGREDDRRECRPRPPGERPDQQISEESGQRHAGSPPQPVEAGATAHSMVVSTMLLTVRRQPARLPGGWPAEVWGSMRTPAASTVRNRLSGRRRSLSLRREGARATGWGVGGRRKRRVAQQAPSPPEQAVVRDLPPGWRRGLLGSCWRGCSQCPRN